MLFLPVAPTLAFPVMLSEAATSQPVHTRFVIHTMNIFLETGSSALAHYAKKSYSP